ncbi:dihydroorotase [Pseudonocardia hierapolitana]|uniref:Dihydroorotase n=1 Tax=Pseudonocardia hierapolitana TaxID=1128676 RepID=A0A561SJG8_9PSEU|nr:dihydroorotase family protein [Pseudonocardia hierapolitana]TWF74974.1 dihydroorotase [Pseudonocardia hierapolitana]
MRVLVTGGTLVTASGQVRADLLCTDGRIAGILESGGAAAADERVDASGLLVFPGFIDPHVHSRDPGQTAKEDFAHSTLAALCSGVTTLLEMPNAVPPISDRATFEERAAAHERTASVDFGLWGQAFGASNLDDLPGLLDAGAVAIKLFWGYALDKRTKKLVYNTGDAAPDDIIAPPDAGDVLRVFEVIGARGGLLAAHCEDREIVLGGERAIGGEIRTYQDLLDGRPALAEIAAVSRAAEFSRVTGCRFHVVHTSTARALEIVRAARADGIPITAEACPHYLLLSDADHERYGSGMKVFPPIRGADDQEALWAAIADGTVASVGSDHAPHTLEELEGSLATRPAGVHGVETMVPLMLNEMARGRLAPERVAAVLAEQTARLYSIDHRKGRIAPGLDADLTLVDPHRERRIVAGELHTKHKASVYDGWTVRGTAVASLLRGEVVMRDGEPVAQRRGRLVRTSAAEAADAAVSVA